MGVKAMANSLRNLSGKNNQPIDLTLGVGVDLVNYYNIMASLGLL